VRFSRFLVVSAVAATLVGGALVGPAAAHSRAITEVYTSVWEDGTINTQAWLDRETHAGTMKITLKKRNAAGDWVAIATKKAVYQLGWGYTVNFSPVAGDKRCKAVARFTSNNHPTLTKASAAFDC
jgi:hypothetical protein